MINLNKSVFMLASSLALAFVLGFISAFLIKTNMPFATAPKQAQAPIGITETNEIVHLEPQFKVLNYRFDRETDFAYLRGEVQNIGTNTLRNVEILASVYDAKGNLIESSKAYLELSPLSKGQISAFQIMFKSKPIIKTAKINAFRVGELQIPFLIH